VEATKGEKESRPTRESDRVDPSYLLRLESLKVTFLKRREEDDQLEQKTRRIVRILNA